jgi:hypothetical protein
MRFIILFLLLSSAAVYAQQITLPSIDSLRQQLIDVKADVENIKINLTLSEKKFKRGIAVATLGYSVTIAGGLMLGGKKDDLGKVLLIAGGVSGITGTILMVDAFKYLGRVSRKKSKENKLD